MENRSFYNEILTEHNLHPEFKHDLPDADIVLEGVNPSCGDDIFLKLKLDGDTIADGAFVGDGCAISQASADIMLGMIIGKKKEDALKLGEVFLKMIQGEATEEEIDSLEEASALRDIAHMPARVKCAVLGWRTLKEALKEQKITAQRLYVLHFILRSYADRKNQIIRYRGGQKTQIEFFDLHGVLFRRLNIVFLPPIPPKKRIPWAKPIAFLLNLCYNS